MVAWWVMASSSSVVMPGSTAAPTSSRTSAAMAPEVRIRSMISGGWTLRPRPGGGWPVAA